MSRFKITTHRFGDGIEFDSPEAPDGFMWALIGSDFLIDDLDCDIGDPARMAVITWELRPIEPAAFSGAVQEWRKKVGR